MIAATKPVDATAEMIYAIREAIEEKLCSASDVELVEFFHQNNDLLNQLANNDEFLERVGEAEDRLKKAVENYRRNLAKTVATVPIQVPRPTEHQPVVLVDLLRNLNLQMAADYADVDFEELDGRQANEAAESFKWAVEKYGHEIQDAGQMNDIMTLLGTAMARCKTVSIQSALYFIGCLIRLFNRLEQAEFATKAILDTAQNDLDRSLPSSKWSRWAIRTLDSLLTEADNEASEFLVLYPEAAGAENPAATMIDWLRAKIQALIAWHRSELDARKKPKNELRQLRADYCQQMRGSSDDKSDNRSKGKRSKRSANDPHRNGKK